MPHIERNVTHEDEWEDLERLYIIHYTLYYCYYYYHYYYYYTDIIQIKPTRQL